MPRLDQRPDGSEAEDTIPCGCPFLVCIYRSLPSILQLGIPASNSENSKDACVEIWMSQNGLLSDDPFNRGGKVRASRGCGGHTCERDPAPLRYLLAVRVAAAGGQHIAVRRRVKRS